MADDAHVMNKTEKTYKSFTINGTQFKAANCIDGVLVNPKLPANLDNTANEARPTSHRKFYNLSYIETISDVDFDPIKDTDKYADERRKSWIETGRASWFKAWPSGTRYDVRCLDGGAWDRSTAWGMFATIEEAIKCAMSGPSWRKSA